MINNIVLVGRLTKDIEVRYTEGNTAVGNFNIAVQRNYKNTNGDYETDFLNCVSFGKVGETMKEYCHKGDLIAVKGRLQTRNYEDKEGNKRFVSEVVAEKVCFLSPKKNAQNNENIVQKEESDPFKEFGDEIADEDLPF